MHRGCWCGTTLANETFFCPNGACRLVPCGNYAELSRMSSFVMSDSFDSVGWCLLDSATCGVCTLFYRAGLLKMKIKDLIAMAVVSSMALAPLAQAQTAATGAAAGTGGTTTTAGAATAGAAAGAAGAGLSVGAIAAISVAAVAAVAAGVAAATSSDNNNTSATATSTSTTH